MIVWNLPGRRAQQRAPKLAAVGGAPPGWPAPGTCQVASPWQKQRDNLRIAKGRLYPETTTSLNQSRIESLSEPNLNTFEAGSSCIGLNPLWPGVVRDFYRPRKSSIIPKFVGPRDRSIGRCRSQNLPDRRAGYRPEVTGQ